MKERNSKEKGAFFPGRGPGKNRAFTANLFCPDGQKRILRSIPCAGKALFGRGGAKTGFFSRKPEAPGRARRSLFLPCRFSGKILSGREELCRRPGVFRAGDFQAAHREVNPFAALVFAVLALFRILSGTAFSPPLFAQEDQAGPPGNFPATQIPPLVYVGDRARLVVELGPAFAGAPPEVIDDPLLLPRAPDLSVHRVEIEKRQGRARLLVDFSAWTPGRHALPVIRTASGVFSSLEVEIASILEPERGGRPGARRAAGGTDRVLSPPAPPLAVPGTMLLVYGAAAAALAAVIFALAGRKWFPGILRWLEKIRRRRVFRTLERQFRLFRENLEAGGESRAVLENLNREFRRFLTFLTGTNCEVMVPGEFSVLPGQGDGFGGAWFRRFFRRMDSLRFGGAEASAAEAGEILEDARLCLDAAFRRENAPRSVAANGSNTAKDGGAAKGSDA